MNKVYENLKANISFGGLNSGNSSIIGNEIYNGRCEGLFIIDGGPALIIRN